MRAYTVVFLDIAIIAVSRIVICLSLSSPTNTKHTLPLSATCWITWGISMGDLVSESCEDSQSL